MKMVDMSIEQKYQLCPNQSQWVYIGKNARNAYTWDGEHMKNTRKNPPPAM
jgi:hypothetical protein